MKFAFLTNGNNFFTQTLKYCTFYEKAADILILLEFPLSLSNYKRKGERISVFLFFKLVYRFIVKVSFIASFLIDNRKFFRSIKFINSVKSNRSIKWFIDENFDVIFLGGMSILDSSIIKSVNIGIYNCHPALIPNVRGVDVIYHSVINRIPLFVSIHKVDEGIDTGELIELHRVPTDVFLSSCEFNDLCVEVIEFAAKEFAKFIDSSIIKGHVSKMRIPSLKYPNLVYCRHVSDKDYQKFFTMITETEHQSNIILISQEKCAEMHSLDQQLYPIKCLELSGLNDTSILDNTGLNNQDDWLTLIQLYEGNPTYLKDITSLIQDVYDGEVAEFLAENSLIISQNLQSHFNDFFNRLSSIEQQITLELSKLDQSISREDLKQKLPLSSVDFVNGLQSLQQRYLVTKIKEDKILFKLSPVFREYLRITV
jgi:hypothetical protein